MAINSLYGLIFVVMLMLVLLSSMIKVLREYERGVIFRLGRLLPKPKGPGLIFLIPGIDRMQRISLRTIVMDVPPQDVITKDNVSVKVNAVIFFRVMEPGQAVVEVEDYMYATSQLAQTTLRSVLGQSELDELLSSREKINEKLQDILDRHTDPWGIKVSTVEVKHVDLPEVMQRAMSRQAEAERDRRAKVINAEGGVPGLTSPGRSLRRDRGPPDGPAVAFPADSHRGGCRKQQHGRLSCAYRLV